MSFFTKNINLRPVVEAIDDDKNLDSESRLSAKEYVWILAESYLERDFSECRVLFTEEKFNTPQIAGTIDLILEVTNPIYLPKTSKGKKLIVDWKTSNSNTFDKAFKDRYINSWQWKIYSQYGHANLFEYRIIGKGTGETIEILLENSKSINDSVENYLEKVNLMKECLSECNDFWPQHMPQACNTYGKSCPYKHDCENNIYIPGVDIREPLHYSNIETFLLCPERFRRGEISRQNEGLDSHSTTETLIGSAVHRGMEEIYRQLKELQT